MLRKKVLLGLSQKENIEITSGIGYGSSYSAIGSGTIGSGTSCSGTTGSGATGSNATGSGKTGSRYMSSTTYGIKYVYVV